MAPPVSPPHGDSFVDKSPCLLKNSRVVARRQFVWIWNGAPELGKDLVCLRPRLISWQSEQEVHPSLEVAQVILWGGASQAPHDHEVVVFVPWVPDGHLPEKPAIGPHNVVRPRPHPPPLTYHRPSCPVLAPCAPLRKEVTFLSLPCPSVLSILAFKPPATINSVPLDC